MSLKPSNPFQKQALQGPASPENTEPELPSMEEVLGRLRGKSIFGMGLQEAESDASMTQVGLRPEVMAADPVPEAKRVIDTTALIAGRQAMDKLQAMGVDLALPKDMSAEHYQRFNALSDDEVSVLAATPRFGISTEKLSEITGLAEESLSPHLMALTEAGFVEATRKSAITLTDLGVSAVFHGGKTGDTVPYAKRVLDFQLAGINRGFAEANGTPRDVLQGYLTAIAREQSSKEINREESLPLIVAHVRELHAMCHGVATSDSMPQGFDLLADKIQREFSFGAQASVSGEISKIREAQLLFDLSAELGDLEGRALLDKVSDPATFATFHKANAGLSTIQIASQTALWSLGENAEAHPHDAARYGATPDNAARIAKAVIEGAGNGARITSFAQFEALLDPGVSALAATSSEGQRLLKEHLDLQGNKEKMIFLHSLIRPTVHSQPDAKSAHAVLMEVARQIGLEINRENTEVVRSAINASQNFDANFTNMVDAIKEELADFEDRIKETPTRDQEPIRRSFHHSLMEQLLRIQDDRGVEGLGYFMTFLAHLNPASAREDMENAILAARELSNTKQIDREEQIRARNFMVLGDNFLRMAVGNGVSNNLKLIDSFNQRIGRYLDDLGRGGETRIARLRELLNPETLPAFIANTPRNATFADLNVRRSIEFMGIQDEEIRRFFPVDGLRSWERKILRSGAAEQPEVTPEATQAASSDTEQAPRITLHTPEGGWTRREFALLLAKNDNLSGSAGALWYVSDDETLVVPFYRELSQTEAQQVISSSRFFDGKVFITGHGENIKEENTRFGELSMTSRINELDDPSLFLSRAFTYANRRFTYYRISPEYVVFTAMNAGLDLGE